MFRQLIIAVFMSALLLVAVGCTKKEMRDNRHEVVTDVKDTSKRVWTDVKSIPSEVKEEIESDD